MNANSRSFRLVDGNVSGNWLRCLREQQAEGRFCDIGLNVQDKCFPAHRNVLAASSLFFASVLKHHKVLREEMRLNNCEPRHVQLLLDYVYSCDMTIDEENVRDVALVSDFFILPNLRQECEDWAIRHLSPENCLMLRQLSRSFAFHRLESAVVRFMRLNSDKILSLPEIIQMNFVKFETLLCDISDGHDNCKPVHLLPIIAAWTKKDIPSRCYKFKRLLQHLNWSDCKIMDLVDHLQSESLYEESRITLLLLLRTMQSEDVDLGPFQSTLLELNQTLGDVMSESDENCEDQPEELTRGIISVEILSPEKESEQDSTASDSEFLLHDESGEISLAANINGHLPAVCEALDDKGAISSPDADRISSSDEECHSHLNSEPLSCPHCEYSSFSVTRLEQHLAYIHEEDQKYCCLICDYHCRWNRDYCKHLTDVHFVESPFKCEVCSFSCSDVQSFLAHSLKHNCETYSYCEFCSYKSKNQSFLKLHSKSHCIEKPFRCEHCGRCFCLQSTLNQHLATHANIDNGTDSLNWKTCYQSSHEQRPVESPITVYHCQQPACSYFSTRRSQLAAHIRSHLSIRSHCCSTCGRRFIERSHLIRHERIHLKEKPFKCIKCEYSSTRRDKLKEHVQKHHQEDDQVVQRLNEKRRSRKRRASSGPVADVS